MADWTPTGKQAAFIREYLIDLNAAGAAQRAGYAKSNLKQTGRELLRHPHVGAAIRKELAKREERTRITADRVVVELSRIAFGELEAETTDRDGNPIISRPTIAERTKALELLGRHLAIFSERHEITIRKPPSEMSDDELKQALLDAGLL